jgi:hypothetical protein
VGLDFPFGLPKAVLPQPTWRQFIVSFPDLYASPEAFRQTCYRSAAGRELKRVTDVECKTPFSPYNLRLYRQSYFGMRDVLNPLVRSRQAHVVPMQPARLGKPWLLEICPASTLKQANLYLPYKGKSPRHHAARIGILKWLGSGGRLSLSRTVMRSIVLSDPEGDALDSILAAFATFRAVSDPHRLVDGGRHDYMLEGCVFV